MHVYFNSLQCQEFITYGHSQYQCVIYLYKIAN